MSKFLRKTSSSTTPSSFLHPSCMTRTESRLIVSGKQKQEKGSKTPPFLPLPHMRTRPDDATTPISCHTFIFDIDTIVDSTPADDSITGKIFDFHHSVQNPLASSIYNFYVLIETTRSNESNDKENVEGFLVDAIKSGLVSDGAISQDLNQASSFGQIREGIPEALQKAGVVYKYDLSIPVKKIKTGGKANVVGYGHLGDGNLHLNVSAPQYDDVILAETKPFVYEWTSKQHGSISAEHGLGLMKAEKIYYSKSTATDYDPYVRKIAVICVAKLYDINDKLVEDRGILVLLMCLVSSKVVVKVGNKFL
ncbi:unnamed protein product [Lactuca virosa]|uniref:FAD-binding oxidoreductase/transferase type 4 C-terminal domain-containing protein n=1 Tax=Lactuca virosa TaxID=75947 RepID=A0AAU9M0D4_9ASTR|nr:unnamed protein product [Lactuca virosa]